MVLTLTVMVFISACSVDSVLIILLALLNDISMLPIAHDHVSASRLPELPRVYQIIIRATFYGILSTLLGMLFFYTINPMADTNPDLFTNVNVEFFCSTETSAVIWLFLTILSESLIFTVRVPTGFFWQAHHPAISLVISVFLTDLLASVLAGAWKGVTLRDILITWAFAIASFFVVDFCKVVFFCYILGEETGSTITFQQFLDADDDLSSVQDVDVEASTKSQTKRAAKVKRQSVHLEHQLSIKERMGHREMDSKRVSWFSLHGARHHSLD